MENIKIISFMTQNPLTIYNHNEFIIIIVIITYCLFGLINEVDATINMITSPKKFVTNSYHK